MLFIHLVYHLYLIRKIPPGTYILISHGQPSYRLTYLQRPEFGWDVKVHTVGKPTMGMASAQPTDDKEGNVHYIYVCQRGSDGSGGAGAA